jgi:hypothetical protein
MDDERRVYRVIVTMTREYSATLPVLAANQAEADSAALAAFHQNACENGLFGTSLGLPEPWEENEGLDHDAEIETSGRCVDCGEETPEEYYMVRDELWAAAGLAPNGGRLCLADLERRIGRPLEWWDFTHLTPTLAAWKRHVTARQTPPTVPAMQPLKCGLTDRSRNET